MENYYFYVFSMKIKNFDGIRYEIEIAVVNWRQCLYISCSFDDVDVISGTVDSVEWVIFSIFKIFDFRSVLHARQNCIDRP